MSQHKTDATVVDEGCACEVDIKENDILKRDPILLDTLLLDQSHIKQGDSGSNIIWATDTYEKRGPEYAESAQITVAAITGENGNVVMPRTSKSEEEQRYRSRDKAEVFTPSWICNKQNNLIDGQWFGANSPFNTETDDGWKTNPEPVPFPTADGKTWQDYVADTRLEITCGEAPYLASRYDTITGEIIPVPDRIGLLDRKLRVISENTETIEEWEKAAKKAYQSTYGYEWQGDNLLLARENLLYTYFDFFKAKFGKEPTKKAAREIATIISWNIWQMDGIKGVIPNSCHDTEQEEWSLFDDAKKIVIHCPGCEKDDIQKHNGIYCYIKDWSAHKTLRFVDMIKP